MWEIILLGVLFLVIAVAITFALAILIAYASQIAYVDPLNEGLEDD